MKTMLKVSRELESNDGGGLGPQASVESETRGVNRWVGEEENVTVAIARTEMAPGSNPALTSARSKTA